MRCNERKCDRCGDTTSAWVLYVASQTTLCAGCVTAEPVDATGLVECRCGQCGRLFAGDPDHAPRFCSLACERAAQQIADQIPW